MYPPHNNTKSPNVPRIVNLSECVSTHNVIFLFPFFYVLPTAIMCAHGVMLMSATAADDDDANEIIATVPLLHDDFTHLPPST